MPKRPNDSLTIEGERGRFDAFTSLEVTNDLTAPAEASFEVGDDASFRSLESVLGLGSRFTVTLNGKTRLTGRVETQDVPVDAQGGATVRFVVRTKLADAWYASADPRISIQHATLKDIVLRAYGPLGYKETDFIFRGDVSRDIMTGKSSRRHDKPVQLERLELQQAKVQPPEAIYEFVERHLLRFRMTHWDAPDGRICVGAPNDFQDPLYAFRCLRGRDGRENNVLSAHRIRDVSEAPTTISVVGMTRLVDDGIFEKVQNGVQSTLVDASLFHRPVFIVDPQIANRDQAFARAMRELVHRSKKLDAWEIGIDGWSFWDGQSATPYGIDTVADVKVDVAGGSTGPYLVHRVTVRRDPDNGDVAQLTMLKQGLWRL
jgi:prophage tail gpP-like protein